MTYTPIHTRTTHIGDAQSIYRFPNGYGASLIEGPGMAYGGREMAVVYFTGPGHNDFGLEYDTPITDYVLGWLSPDGVPALLDRIAALPARVSA